jgi:uncharacterized protein (TIGR02646 family)
VIDVTRRAEAPASLAAQKRYSGDDVVEALHEDFLGKCYLCESKVRPGTFQIDHRRQQRQFPHLTYTWTNLFPTCNEHNCNGRRQQFYPDGGLLDPGAGHRLEERLVQSVEHPSGVLTSKETRFTFKAVQDEDVAASNTSKELDRIHNATDSTARWSVRALRAAILERVTLIADKLRELESAEGDTRAKLEAELRELFSRRSPYTMLVRSCFEHLESAKALFE